MEYAHKFGFFRDPWREVRFGHVIFLLYTFGVCLKQTTNIQSADVQITSCIFYSATPGLAWLGDGKWFDLHHRMLLPTPPPPPNNIKNTNLVCHRPLHIFWLLWHTERDFFLICAFHLLKIFGNFYAPALMIYIFTISELNAMNCSAKRTQTPHMKLIWVAFSSWFLNFTLVLSSPTDRHTHGLFSAVLRYT